MEKNQAISAQAFAAKFKSKREIYQLLTVDAKAYLPPYDAVTIYFLKDLISGEKKCKLSIFSDHAFLVVKCADIIHVFVPAYEGLGLKEIAEFLGEHNECHPFFPIGKEQQKLPKQWVVNVAASIFKDVFHDWVKDRIVARNKKVTVQKDVMISLDPDIAAAFNSSTSVSRKWISIFSKWNKLFNFCFLLIIVAKGVGFQMLRVG